MRAKVSVIVPIYRIPERYLRQCIDSLIGQTLREIEILLIDDGSPDNADEICEEYAARDDRIIVIHQENQGVSVARNTGLDHAEGTYIMFADPDDWLEVDCCEQVYREIDCRGCDVVFFQAYRESEYKHEAIYTYINEPRELTREDIRLAQLDTLAGNPMPFGIDMAVPWGRIVRRDFLERHELRFVPGIKKQQDTVWHLYLYEFLDRAYVMAYAGYHYRLHMGSVCHKYNPQMPRLINEVEHECDKFICRYHPDDERYHRALGCRCTNSTRDIAIAFLFHSEYPSSYERTKQVISEYMDDPVVKAYVRKANIRGFRNLNAVIRFLLLRYRWFRLYHGYNLAVRQIKKLTHKD